MDKPLTQEDSLVKYTNPVLVADKDEEKLEPTKVTSGARKRPVTLTTKDLVSDKNKEIREILDCILPPKEWEEKGQLWRQQVSSEPATRAETVKLGEALDTRLQQRNAREVGMCAIRRELYAQAFDEIIRQVTINCAERGLLLLRIRDEMNMSLNAYQALYESSIAYGIRKSLAAEEGKLELEEEAERLKKEKEEMKLVFLDLSQKYEMMEHRAAEIREAEQKAHNEEISFLKKTNQQLKAQLEAIIVPSKK
ncbi:hypothetical protein O3M35_009307 [Rhynocoris fuscipes]|uniref:Uncharacterized protein n=1 Tax=Rhynocoris fuscipes TaxID=488301 RepID=A0AAW1D3R3_9HEMI